MLVHIPHKVPLPTSHTHLLNHPVSSACVWDSDMILSTFVCCRPRILVHCKSLSDSSCMCCQGLNRFSQTCCITTKAGIQAELESEISAGTQIKRLVPRENVYTHLRGRQWAGENKHTRDPQVMLRESWFKNCRWPCKDILVSKFYWEALLKSL